MRCGGAVSPGEGGALAEAAGAGAATGVPLTAESTDAGAEAPLTVAAFALAGVRPVGVLGASDDFGMSLAQASAETNRSTAGVCLDDIIEDFTWTQGYRRQSMIRAPHSIARMVPGTPASCRLLLANAVSRLRSPDCSKLPTTERDAPRPSAPGSGRAAPPEACARTRRRPHCARYHSAVCGDKRRSAASPSGVTCVILPARAHAEQAMRKAKRRTAAPMMIPSARALPGKAPWPGTFRAARR